MGREGGDCILGRYKICGEGGGRLHTREIQNLWGGRGGGRGGGRLHNYHLGRYKIYGEEEEGEETA